MKKTEAEKGIRYLCQLWRSLPANKSTEPKDLNAHDFLRWLNENHTEYLDFRSIGGAADQVERWFNDEMHVPHYFR